MTEQSIPVDRRLVRKAARRKRALTFYRIMAFTTGTVLLFGTLVLIAQGVDKTSPLANVNGGLWMAHGYLFMIYIVATVNLGLSLRWHPVKLVCIAAAGTIPTMSFVAERFVTRRAQSGVTQRP